MEFRVIAGGMVRAPREVMRTIAIVVSSLAISATAAANPMTFGASLGLSASKVDSDNGADATGTLGLFGRLGFSSRLAGQLEVARYKSESGCATCTFGTTTNIRTATALLVVDLTDTSKSWVPTLMAGIGVDRDDGSYPTTGHHIEGGLGIEYRGDGGITLGADVRMGSRSIDSNNDVLAGSSTIRFAPTQMQEGEYRSGRITLGIRF